MPAAALPRSITRRTVLAAALAAAGLATAGAPPAQHASATVVRNVTGLYSVDVARIATARSTAEVAVLVRSHPGQVAVGGGRFSMGGQVAVRGGLHLDMRQMAGLVWLRPEQRTARVQAGMTWRDLQDHLDPHGLAVRVMQSYANFTIGGSVSVNAHGRYVGLGPVGNTVRALQLVLADGTVVEATPTSHFALFRAAIGGYGGIGVITEVELDLAENVRIERSVRRIPLADYVAHFRSEVLADTDALLHNADLHPPAFREPVCTSWRRAGEKPLTVVDRLVARGQAYGTEQNLLWAISELPAGHALRKAVVQPRLETTEVKWLNHEASMDVAQLEPRTRTMSTYVLQEYFVPPASLVSFVTAMATVLQAHRANVLNVSIRHSPADVLAVLPWAKTESFSLVLYYKQRSSAGATRSVGQWTRALIDLVLAHGGRYYLPYQPHATRAQFEAAYPEAAEFRRIKSQVDPSGKLSNELWRKYL